MYEMQALTSFDHHGSLRVGDKFKVGNKRQAEEFEKKGLAKIVGEPASEDRAAKSDAVEKPAPKKAAKKAAG